MTDNRWQPDKIRVEVAQDLREVVRLWTKLGNESEHQGISKDAGDLDVLNLIAPAANLEAWENQYEAAETRSGASAEWHSRVGGRDYASDQVAELHPELVLATWEDCVREELGTPTDKRANVPDAAKYLASALVWMTDTNEHGDINFIAIDQLHTEVRKCRAMLENVLKDGVRFHRINAECKNCDEAPRLCLRRGKATDGSQDHWYCPNKACRHVYDAPGVAACWRQMLVRRGEPPEWLTIMAAATAIGRSPRTIRRWIRDLSDRGNTISPKVESRRQGERVEVRWSDVRAANDTTRRRGLYRKVA